MKTQLFILLQYVLPQRLLSCIAGWLAESHLPWLKNFLIKQFIKRYKIDLQETIIETPGEYATFNQFFTRQFKPGVRPIAAGREQIVSPVDGSVSQISRIKQNELIQAKSFYFDLNTLLGNDSALAEIFYDGHFATLYLAPHNYHRVHMPITGSLDKTIYVPGKLFSVCPTTAKHIPQLYSRNERLISLFTTDAGPTAIILVGAMLVGNIQTVWQRSPIRSASITTQIDSHSDKITLTKGDELGYFKMGSTVILLFTKDKIEWLTSIKENTIVQVGQLLGKIPED